VPNRNRTVRHSLHMLAPLKLSIGISSTAHQYTTYTAGTTHPTSRSCQAARLHVLGAACCVGLPSSCTGWGGAAAEQTCSTRADLALIDRCRICREARLDAAAPTQEQRLPKGSSRGRRTHQGKVSDACGSSAIECWRWYASLDSLSSFLKWCVHKRDSRQVGSRPLAGAV